MLKLFKKANLKRIFLFFKLCSILIKYNLIVHCNYLNYQINL